MPKKILLLFCALISGGPPLQWEGTKNRREGGLFWDSPQGAEGLWAGKGGHKQTGDAAFFSTQGGLFISKGPRARPLIGKSSIADSSMLLQRVRSAEVSACEGGRAAAQFSLKALRLTFSSRPSTPLRKNETVMWKLKWVWYEHVGFSQTRRSYWVDVLVPIVTCNGNIWLQCMMCYLFRLHLSYNSIYWKSTFSWIFDIRGCVYNVHSFKLVPCT